MISHVHLDHLHVPSLRRFGPATRIIVPAGAGRLLGRKGFQNVDEAKAGDTFDAGRLTVETVRAVHPPGRGPHSSIVAEPVGYVLRTDDAAVYFAGDTDLFDTMADLAPIDVALLPIWGWGPTLGEGHLNPERAATAATLLRARVVIPVHWGTYSPIGVRRPKWLDTPVHQFADALRAVDMIDALPRAGTRRIRGRPDRPHFARRRSVVKSPQSFVRPAAQRPSWGQVVIRVVVPPRPAGGAAVAEC